MVRYLITATGALAMLSGVALAQDSTTTIIRGPGSVSKSTTEQHLNDNGDVVTKEKTVKENGSGSSTTTESRTVTDPMSGDTVTRSRTTIEK